LSRRPASTPKWTAGLHALGTEAARSLRGRAAVAQAKLAYQLFRERFAGERWDALAAAGAHVQRPQWASTSTKNPPTPCMSTI